LRRVLPVLEALRGRLRIPVSIDTRKAAVADAASQAGAEIVNDVTAFRADAEMAPVAQRRRLGIILMHMRGDPRSMQRQPFARNVFRDVSSALRESIRRAESAGVFRSRIVLDPGIGFGKSFRQNYELLARLPALARLGYPLLVGASRKAFLGKTLRGVPPQARIWGNAATVAASILAGAHIVRVHDVAEMAQVALVADEILKAASGMVSRK
jgi:dihydropteroate synthase